MEVNIGTHSVTLEVKRLDICAVCGKPVGKVSGYVYHAKDKNEDDVLCSQACVTKYLHDYMQGKKPEINPNDLPF